MSNIDTVHGIYAAFGKGDIPAILEHVAQDCDWEYAYADTGVPWLERRRGKEGVAAFFSAVGANLDFDRFAAETIVAARDGALVIAICNLSAKVRATGATIVEQDEVHLWHFDARGCVARFRHCADTLQQHRAMKPQSVEQRTSR